MWKTGTKRRNDRKFQMIKGLSGTFLLGGLAAGLGTLHLCLPAFKVMNLKWRPEGNDPASHLLLTFKKRALWPLLPLVLFPPLSAFFGINGWKDRRGIEWSVTKGLSSYVFFMGQRLSLMMNAAVGLLPAKRLHHPNNHETRRNDSKLLCPVRLMNTWKTRRTLQTAQSFSFVFIFTAHAGPWMVWAVRTGISSLDSRCFIPSVAELLILVFYGRAHGWKNEPTSQEWTLNPL